MCIRDSFWDVQKGKITVGGKDIKSMEPESLMSYMSFVFQDVTLFNDTVMNNIRLGNPSATDDQVIAADKMCIRDRSCRTRTINCLLIAFTKNYCWHCLTKRIKMKNE